MSEPVKIGDQTFIKTDKGWVDKKTKAPAPKDLLLLLNAVSTENAEVEKKKRVRVDTSRPVVKLGSTEYVWDLNGENWIDKKTRTPVAPWFSSVIEETFQKIDQLELQAMMGVFTPYGDTKPDNELYKKENDKAPVVKSVIDSIGMIGQQQTGTAAPEADASKIQSTPVSKGLNSSIVKMIDQLVIMNGYIDQNLKNKVLTENNKKLAEREADIEQGEKDAVSEKSMSKSAAAAVGLGLLGLAGLALFASKVSDAFSPVVDAVKGVGEFVTSIYEKIASALTFGESNKDKEPDSEPSAFDQYGKPILGALVPIALGGPATAAGIVGGAIGRAISDAMGGSKPATPAPADAVKETQKKTTSGYVYPVEGYGINSPYGMRGHPTDGGRKFHTGVDIAAPEGTPVKAAKSGVVTKAEFGKSGSGYGSFGNVVVVDHGDGMQTVYAHLSGYAAKAGDKVSAGQTIGYVGSTGKSTGNHLHFIVQKSGLTVPTEKNTVDPTPLLKGGKLEIPVDASSTGGTPQPTTQAKEEDDKKKEKTVLETMAETIGLLGATIIGPGKIRNINASLQDLGSKISNVELEKVSSIVESKNEKMAEAPMPSPPNINTSDFASIENPPTMDDRNSVFYYLERFGHSYKRPESSLMRNTVMA